MKTDIIAAQDIDTGIESLWRQYQSADSNLKSPFFSPEFARAVASVRKDTRVAIAHDSHGIQAFFAFNRPGLGRLVPLAGQISDYHGIVGAADHGMDMPAVLKAAGAQAYDFNHAPAAQDAFSTEAFRFDNSPLVDLTGGFEAWDTATRARVKSYKGLDRKRRKIEREIGPLRFVANDRAPDVWETFMGWKRASLARMGQGFILDERWARDIIDAIRPIDTPAFAGETSALYAGDRLVAVHVGMRSDRARHWWFPSYDDDLAKYSPGLLMTVECIRDAAERGLEELDFGRGDQRYKSELSNGARALCEGSIERPVGVPGATRRLRKRLMGVLSNASSERVPDLARRASNRLLRAGKLS